MLDIFGNGKLLRGDQNEPDALVAGHGGDKGMDGTAEFKVAAQAHRQVGETPLFSLDGEKVGEGLGGMVVSAVTRIDNGN